MITLNLLPPEERENLKLAKFSRVLAYYSMGIFALLVIFIVLLVSILAYLMIQLNSLEKLAEQTEKNQSFTTVKELETEIDSLNQKMKTLDSVQQGANSFSLILEDLAKIAPSGVEFFSFNYDGQTKKAVLDGHSLSREGFIALREAIEKDQRFSDIESPISNLVKSTDNNFRISFKIK